MRRAPFVKICFAVSLLWFSSHAWSQKSSEWELEVKGEKADVHLVPDTKSTTVATLPGGFLLKSYEKINDWFRVVIGPDEDGIVTIGYVQARNVKVLHESIVEDLDYWEEEADFFEGLGLSLRLAMGPSRINAGDIRTGTQGWLDDASDLASSYGYMIDRRPDSIRSGFGVSADVVYNLTSRIGLGIGFGYIHQSAQSFLIIRLPNRFDDEQIDSAPRVTAWPIRVGVYYHLPIHRLLDVHFQAGAAYYFARYSYGRRTTWEAVDRIYQKANGGGFGLHGGAGIELNFHPRAALILEGLGRMVKISHLEGKETVRKAIIPPIKYDDIKSEGKLYYVQGEKFPFLAVSKNAPTGYGTVRKATLDLSGIYFQAGIKIKF